ALDARSGFAVSASTRRQCLGTRHQNRVKMLRFAAIQASAQTMQSIQTPRSPALVAAVASSALLAWGAVAAAADGRLSATGVLVGSAVVVATASAIIGVLSGAAIAVIGWLTSVGFATAPYADLTGPGRPLALPAAVLATATAIGVGIGATTRGFGITLEDMAGDERVGRRPTVADLVSAVDARRQRIALGLAAASLVLLTVVLTSLRSDLSLADVLLI